MGKDARVFKELWKIGHQETRGLVLMAQLCFGGLFVCLFLAKSVGMAEAPSWMLVQLIIPVEFLPPKTLISLHFKR